MGIMNNSDLSYQTALETARLIRTREVSALEVMDATIARVEAANDKLNAFTYTAFDEARDKARQADKLLGKSRSSSARDNQQVAPLLGVPIAMKDSSSLKPNWPISFGGIPQLKEYTPALSNATSYFVKKMEAAGAIFIGRTNAPIMGFRGTTDNPAFGPTCNPFDLSKNAGGSSGGSAAAVSSGLLPISHATDGGGSIRIPAAWTNCVGYKASSGRIPAITRPNAFNDSAPYVYEGTITRTVEDTLLSLSILSGMHQDDPHSFPFPPIASPDGTSNGLSDNKFNSKINSKFNPLKGIKIGYSPNLDVFPVEEEVAHVVADAVKTLQEAGAEVEEIKIGIKANHNELSDIWCRLVVPATRSLFNYIKDDAGINLFAKEHRHVLPTELIRWVEEIGATYSADAMYQDLIVRTEVFDAYQETLSKYDLIASPTLSAMPVKNTTDGDTMGPSRINGEEVNPLIGWCPTLLTNFTGHPSISVPAGLGRSGMPVGLHLTGRRGADVQVLSAAAYFEIIRPWKQHYSRITSLL